MRRSIPLLMAVGSCVLACQGALDLDRYSFGSVGAGAGGAAGSSGGGASGDGGSSNAGAGNGGTAGNSAGGAGGSGGVPPEPEQAVAVFDHYRFARGGVTYGVGAEAGLLLNDPGALTAVAGVVSTERGGTADVAADGGFIYTPTVGTWGDDFFEYTLAESQSRARVRLTLTPGTVPLGDVAGTTDNGFVILGAGMNAGLGAVVAGGGDVNGDGRADLLVSGGGVAYVVFGKNDAAPVRTLDLAPMSSSPAGFAIVPSSAYPQAGHSLANAGDVNGDGLDDILVGTASFNINGSAYVVFGKTTTETVDLAALDAGAGGGFAIVGAATGDAVGLSVSGAGDVNGDGLADVVVGANGTADGTAYVVFGKATLDPFSLGVLNSGLAGGFAVTGPPDDPEGAIAGSAESVAGIGDVNGDGLSDVAFNARGAATSVAYVIFGKRDTALVSVTALGGLGFAIDNGAAVSDQGMIVAAAGDVNGDGFADLVLGDDNADPSNAGAAYVVFGKPDELGVDFVGLKAGLGGGFVIGGGDDFDNAGGSVASAGDFDADGFADLLVGADNAAPGGGASKGKAYLVWGMPGTTAVQLSDVDAEIGGVAIEGALEQDFVGSGVANAGDVDGDGMIDLLVGASGADAVAESAGLAHVLFGWDAREALGARDWALVGTSADDTLGFDGAPLISAAGGNGTDTLSFAGANLSLDLRDRALRIESIEIIDIRGSGDNTLFLDDATVRRLPATRAGLPSGLAKTLVVLADAGDTLFFDPAGYAVIGSNAGRDVYQKTGAFYGIEVSPGVSLRPPSP